MIIHLFGMSNTGKTTLSKELKRKLEIKGLSVEIIDADDYRKTINSDLGFSKEDRIENVRRLQDLADKSDKDVVILCAITPYAISRRPADKLIYLHASLHVLLGRDVSKNVYQNKNVAGVDSPFEECNNFKLCVDTSLFSIKDCTNYILDYCGFKPKYAMFVGRWQTLHDGHRWLFNQRLDKGENILICIRDVPPNKSNPLSAQQVYSNLEQEYKDLISQERVKLLIIPDITSIDYGRDVGYEVIQHTPPLEIEQISGTKIRQGIAINN